MARNARSAPEGFKVKNLRTPNFSHPMTLRESPRNSLPKTHLRRASRNSGRRGASFLCFLALQPPSSAHHTLTRLANDSFLSLAEGSRKVQVYASGFPKLFDC